MKLRYFVIGLIFALAAPMAKAQVFEMYYQGFETTETGMRRQSPTECRRP